MINPIFERVKNWMMTHSPTNDDFLFSDKNDGQFFVGYNKLEEDS
jgi:hypothetical protein